MKKAIVFMFLLTLILTTTFVLAAPSLPHTFIGKVKLNGGSNSLVGHNISAEIGSYGLGIVGTVKSGNSYEVSIDPQGRTGTITFYIGGVKANPTATYEWGGYTENFNLTINEMPSSVACGNGIREPGEQCDVLQLGTGTCENVLGVSGSTGTLSCTSYCTFDYSNCTVPSCGDGIVNGGETCSSCPADAGTCPDDNNRGGGGGGGGGGSITIVKTLPATNGTSTNSSQSGSSSTGNLTEQDNSQEVSPSFITGAVTGVTGFVKSGAGIAVIIIIALGAGIIIFRNRKK